MSNAAKILDKNFEIPSSIDKDGFVFYDAQNFDVYGMRCEGEHFCRMNPDEAQKISQNVFEIAHETAGGRVRFATNSPKIAIIAEYNKIAKLPNYPFSATMGFDIYQGERFIGVFVPPFDATDSYESVLDAPFNDGNMHEYTVNFPICSNIKRLLIGVTNGSFITRGKCYAIDRPVVFYGSSTTQGACASRPGNIYENIVSRALDCDYINLGFAGNALGEEAMARYISNLEMSAFVYDYDYNAPSAGHLKRTHEVMFRIIRDANPTLPIIIMSAPKPYTKEEDLEREDIIYTTYKNAVQNGDKNVYFLSGAKILEPVKDCSLTDNVHPGDVGFYAIAGALIPILKKVL